MKMATSIRVATLASRLTSAVEVTKNIANTVGPMMLMICSTARKYTEGLYAGRLSPPDRTTRRSRRARAALRWYKAFNGRSDSLLPLAGNSLDDSRSRHLRGAFFL